MNLTERLNEFYLENEDRRLSGEADYGVHWADGYTRQRYRVSYIRATGEVYAIGQDGEVGPVEILAIVPPDEEVAADGTGFSTPLPYYRTLDSLLVGWPMFCGPFHDGLRWLRKSLSEYAPASRKLPPWMREDDGSPNPPWERPDAPRMTREIAMDIIDALDFAIAHNDRETREKWIEAMRVFAWVYGIELDESDNE